MIHYCAERGIRTLTELMLHWLLRPARLPFRHLGVHIFYHYGSIDSRNATKTGWGVRRRLIYSGWYWVPTKNGWSFNSIASTNFPSGEVPVIIKPAF